MSLNDPFPSHIPPDVPAEFLKPHVDLRQLTPEQREARAAYMKRVYHAEYQRRPEYKERLREKRRLANMIYKREREQEIERLREEIARVAPDSPILADLVLKKPSPDARLFMNLRKRAYMSANETPENYRSRKRAEYMKRRERQRFVDKLLDRGYPPWMNASTSECRAHPIRGVWVVLPIGLYDEIVARFPGDSERLLKLLEGYWHMQTLRPNHPDWRLVSEHVQDEKYVHVCAHCRMKLKVQVGERVVMRRFYAAREHDKWRAHPFRCALMPDLELNEHSLAGEVTENEQYPVPAHLFAGGPTDGTQSEA